MIDKVKNTVPLIYVIEDFNEEEIFGTFYEKELQKTNQKEFRVKKGYGNSFNSWIDKKISFYKMNYFPNCIPIAKAK